LIKSREANVKTRIVFIFIALLYGSNSFALKLDSSLITELAVFGMDVVAPDGSAMVVPSNATAVALNVTAVTPSSSGFNTVWPCGVASELIYGNANQNKDRSLQILTTTFASSF
jgi:hypothetical protein